MAALVAGVQYSLTSQGHLNENKSLIFVKLTDSAIRAIEDHIRNKNKFTPCPTIQFQGNEGHLKFPSANQSSNRSKGAAGVFKFSLNSSCDIEGPQGSFECIKHSGPRCVERVGSLPCIMRVQANEDVYEVTRNRMAAVEKQHKENCTREIELDKSTGIGRRVKMRCKPVDGGGLLKRKESATPTAYTPPPVSHTRPQGNNNAQKPGNPDILRRSIRERIIHLLAVRPYKKPELLLALNKDGLKDKDKNSLMQTLSSVAQCSNNAYHLLRHVWNDVQEDWPFYSEADKSILKRRRPVNLTPPGSSDGGSGGSPGSPSRSPIGATKRPGYYDGADGFQTKKQRISHYQAPRPPLPHPSPPTPPHDKTPPKPDLLTNLNTAATLAPPPHHPPPHHAAPHPAPPPHHPTKPIQEYPKYLLDYTTIKDSDQRRKYKEDFNANYNEYKKLHSMVDKVTKKFSQLDEKLRREEKGSPNWQRIREQILQEYHESKRNPQHQDAKRRFQYLHEKLSHIKRLVMDYDAKIT